VLALGAVSTAFTFWTTHRMHAAVGAVVVVGSGLIWLSPKRGG